MLGRIVSRLLLVLAVVAQLSAQATPAKLWISGKTVNSITGQVLPGVEVWLVKSGQYDPAAQIQKVLTGDDGAFTFTGLETGKYDIVGQRNGYRRQGYEQHGMYDSAVVVGPGIDSEHVVFRLRPDARIVGTILDDEHEPVPNATIHLFRADSTAGLAQTYFVEQAFTDDRGYYRFSHLEPGGYFLIVTAQPWFTFAQVDGDESHRTQAEQAALDVAFPTTFYPGVTDAASASQIRVNDGEEFTADFTLAAVPAVRLRIKHFNANPQQPKNAMLQQKVFGSTIDPPSQRQIPVEDHVEIRGVPPGKYALKIDSYGPTPSSRMTFVDLTADLDFDADAASAPPLISGVIRMDGKVNLRPQAFARLWNSRTHEMLDTQIGQNGELHFDPDFLRPGSYSVFVVNGENSIIASLSAEGAQVVGQSIQITGSKPIRLSIALSSTLSAVNGIARRDGQPFPGAMILLVPENPETNLPLFRRDQSDSDGTFTLRDVLPGRYRIVAIENGWNMEWARPDLLNSRLDHAVSIEVQPSKTYQTSVNVE